MALSPDATVAVIGAVIVASIPAYLAHRSANNINKRTTALERDKVDQEAYDRAKMIYDGIIQTLEDELERVRKILQDERRDAVTRLNAAQQALDEVRHQVTRLLKFIEDNNLTVPYDVWPNGLSREDIQDIEKRLR